MICPRCNEEILDRSKFCPECGQALKALAVPDQRTHVARPESRPTRYEEPSPSPRVKAVTRVQSERIVEGEFRVIEALGKRYDLKDGAGLLVIYAEERMKERLIEVTTRQNYSDTRPPRELGSTRPLLGDITPAPSLLIGWDFRDSYGNPKGYEYSLSPPYDVLHRTFSKVFRIKQQRLGGFAVYGVAVPVPPGFYEVVLRYETGGDEGTSPSLMVEEGELTEFDLRKL
jgi:hypothetical protein